MNETTKSKIAGTAPVSGIMGWFAVTLFIILPAVIQSNEPAPQWPANVLTGCIFDNQGGICKGTLATLTGYQYQNIINPEISAGYHIAVEAEILSPARKMFVYTDKTAPVLTAEKNQLTQENFLIENIDPGMPGEFTPYFEPATKAAKTLVPFTYLPLT